jgi:hypothetical protein
MSAKMKTLDSRLLTLRCVCCGYEGSLLRDGQARHCARCGCDLRERPPRSYAEMEGLLGEPVTFPDHNMFIRRSSFEQTLAHRWLFFFVMAMIGLVAIACLTAAALSGV